MKNIKKLSFIIVVTLVLAGGFAVYHIVRAVGGEGTATIDGGANATVTTATSHKFTVVLTIGTNGITANAQNPTFTIPAGFTPPDAAPVASAGLVVADGNWSFSAAGGVCTINSPNAGLTVAVDQVITVDVTTVCTVAVPDTITLTYQGQSATATGAMPLNIGTAVDAGAGAVTYIAAPPTITVTNATATLNVIKHVVNDNSGTANASAFTINVTGTNVSDSSFAGAENPGTTITLDARAYSVDETAFNGYAKSLSADCSGTIAAGETKTCTITNDDTAQTISDDDEEDEDNEDKDVAIKVTKKASPSSLSGPGTVVYTYKVTNEGNVALKNVSVKDDKCSSVKYVSGDSNRNSKLGVKEAWKYTCAKKVSTTETNRATARGTNGLTVFDHAKATVVVSAIPGFPNTGIGPDDKSSVPWNIIISIGIFIASFLFYSYLARKKLAI